MAAIKPMMPGSLISVCQKEQPYGSHEYQLDISYGGEHLFMNDDLSNYYYYPGEEETEMLPARLFFLQTGLSTDRDKPYILKGSQLEMTKKRKNMELKPGLKQ